MMSELKVWRKKDTWMGEGEGIGGRSMSYQVGFDVYEILNLFQPSLIKWAATETG